MKSVESFNAKTVMPEDANEKPPLFSSWTGWYLVVITVLIVLVLVFYSITKSFS